MPAAARSVSGVCGVMGKAARFEPGRTGQGAGAVEPLEKDVAEPMTPKRRRHEMPPAKGARPMAETGPDGPGASSDEVAWSPILESVHLSVGDAGRQRHAGQPPPWRCSRCRRRFIIVSKRANAPPLAVQRCIESLCLSLVHSRSTLQPIRLVSSSAPIYALETARICNPAEGRPATASRHDGRRGAAAGVEASALSGGFA